MRTIVLCALVIAACATPTPPTPSPAAAPTATFRIVPPIGTDTPEPIPSRERGPLVVKAAGPLPQRSRLVSVQWVTTVRLWLVDLSNGGARFVARWDVPDRARFLVSDEHWSATRDRRVVVVSSVAASGRAALSLLRIETGEVTPLRDEASADLIAPRLASDGARVAFTRVPVPGDGAHADDGIWTMAVGAKDATRLVAPALAPETSVPAAWSEDGRWLAFRRQFEGSTLFLAGSDGSAPRPLGAGRWVDWRAAEPRLLLADSANAFGSRSAIATYDVANAKRATLYGPTDTIVARPRWQPGRDGFLYIESAAPAFLGPGSFQVFERAVAGTPTARGRPGLLLDAWWSDDGTRVYGVTGGDDSISGVVDIDANRTIASLCLRGDAPPCP